MVFLLLLDPRRSATLSRAVLDYHDMLHLVERSRALRGVHTRTTRPAVRKREAQVLGRELPDVRAAQVRDVLNLGNLQNVDAAEARTVARGHVLVHQLNGLCAAQRTELLVHVVRARARVVAQPDGEVLHLSRRLLLDLISLVVLITHLVDSDNLTRSLLHLTEHAHEVPETRLGHRLILRKDAHTVQRRNRLLLRRKVPSNNKVLRNTAHGSAPALVRDVDPHPRTYLRMWLDKRTSGRSAQVDEAQQLHRPAKTINVTWVNNFLSC